MGRVCHCHVIFFKNIIQTFPTLEQSVDLIFLKENERSGLETVTEILKKKIGETPPNNSKSSQM